MEEKNDSITQIELFKLRIKEKGHVHQSLLRYLGISADEFNKITKKEGKSEELLWILKENNVLTNKCEFRDFLETISHLWENHQPKKEIESKIENLLKILKEDIKTIFSEKEIFAVFRICKQLLILLILVENNLLSVETIVKNINILNNNDLAIIKYFYPEIRKINGKYLKRLMTNKKIYGLKQFVAENDRNLELFYEIRKGRKEETKIIELIKEDKIEEFVSFVEHSSIDLNEIILKKKTLIETIFESTFETVFNKNTKNITPIEYSALFGSISIFKYLYMKEVDINIVVVNESNNIIEYAIQGRNYEIIHLLEDRKEVIEELNNQEKQPKYLEVSIKMHYNEIFEYLMTNFNIQVTEEIIRLMIIYQNYQLLDQLIDRNQIEFKSKTIMNNIFYGFCKNGNEEIVKILITQSNLDINVRDKVFND